MSEEFFHDQSAIASRWRDQIDAVHKQRTEAERSGLPTGHFTTRINKMLALVEKLESVGMKP